MMDEINPVIVRLLMDISELSTTVTLCKIGKISPYVSKTEAIKIVGGESILNRWIKEGLITVIKDGPRNAKVRISRVQLEAVLKVSNRPSYFSLKDFR